MIATAPAPDPPMLGTLQRLKDDLSFYSRRCLTIQDKRARYVALEFNRAQQLVHEKLERQWQDQGSVRAIVLKARQEGISTYVAARFYHRSTTQFHQYALILADEEKRSGKLFEIYERFDRTVPTFVRPLKRYSAKHTHLVYDHKAVANRGLGSEIAVGVASDRDIGRATTVQMAHLSEFASYAYPDDVLISLLQALPRLGSEAIIESTAKGVGNTFHAMWELAESGESDWIAIFIPWWIHEEYWLDINDEERRAILATKDPEERELLYDGVEWEGDLWVLAPEQIAWRRWSIRNQFSTDKRAFKQEYPATAEEAFLVSGNTFFDPDALKAYLKAVTDPVLRGNIEVRTSKDGAANIIVVVPNEKGSVRIWEHPRLDGRYAIGVDTAEGRLSAAHQTAFSEAEAERGGRDFDSATVWDADRKAIVATAHGRFSPEIFTDIVARLGYYYSSAVSVAHNEAGTAMFSTVRRPALVAVERNHSSGQTILRRLRDHYHYGNLHYAQTINKVTDEVKKELGFITSGETRQPMLDELKILMAQRACVCPDRSTIRECMTFVLADDGRPEAQEGTHDDRVMSWAIAVEVARTMPAVYEGTVEDPRPEDLIGASL